MLANTAKRRALVLGLIVGLSACASGSGGGSSRGGSSNHLAAADFDDYANQDILTVIQRMRPNWVHPRGGGTVQGQAMVQVVVDGMVQNGGAEVLRNIRASSVDEVSFMNASDATTRYGTNMVGGVIEVKTKH